MERIADAAVESAHFKSYSYSIGASVSNIPDAMGDATCKIARHRPATPIFAVTAREKTQRRLALVWGVQSALIDEAVSTDVMIAESIAAALQRGIVDIGDLVVLTAGVPAGISSRTNTIQVRVVEKTS